MPSSSQPVLLLHPWLSSPDINPSAWRLCMCFTGAFPPPQASADGWDVAWGHGPSSAVWTGPGLCSSPFHIERFAWKQEVERWGFPGLLCSLLGVTRGGKRFAEPF